MAVLMLAAHAAVLLNMLVSLVTLLAAAAARAFVLPLGALAPRWPEILPLAAFATAVAWFGAGWLARLPVVLLKRIIAALLAAIGALLMAEALVGGALALGADPVGAWRPFVGAGFGLVIGLVASLHGVGDGELIIPTLIVVFGRELREADSASLLISLPAVAVGVWRHARAGGYADLTVHTRIGAPMAAGSVAGALVGAALLPFAQVAALKLGLGAVLPASAWKPGCAGRQPPRTS